MPEIRKSTLTRNEILVATERGARPDDFKERKAESAICPFCPGNEAMTPPPEILRMPRHGPWQIRVVPNKYPAFKIEGVSRFLVNSVQYAAVLNAHGAHEVIVETPKHETSYAELEIPEILNILLAVADRVEDLYLDKDIKYITVFKNFGKDAGASKRHEHTQVIALPQVPQKIRHRLNRLEDYYSDHGFSVFKTVIERAREDNRIILENDNFVCFAPYEAKFPYETWITPKEIIANFPKSRKHFSDLASIISQIFRRFKQCFGELPAFNYFIDDGPPAKSRQCDQIFCWQYRIMPRLTRIAGFELASGYYINPVPPEEAAKQLRGDEAAKQLPSEEATKKLSNIVP